jgi:hypothetical protein
MKQPEGQGLQSITNAFNKTIMALPDMAINSAVIAGEMAGWLPKDIPEQDRRNYLTRFFNEGNYDEKRKLWGVLNIGAGEEHQPVGALEKAGAMIGQGAAIGAGVLGAAGKAATVTDAAIGATGVKIGEKAPSVLQQTGTDIARSFQQAPATFAAADAAANVGSSIGAVAGGEAEKAVTGTESGVGETLGGVVGGMPSLITKAVPSWVVKPVKWVATHTPGITLARKAGELAMVNFDNPVSREMHRGVIDSAMKEAYIHADKTGRRDIIERIRQYHNENGLTMPKFGVAEETGDPTAAFETMRLESQATGQQASENKIRREGLVDWAKGFKNHVLGTDEDAPSMVIEALRNDNAGKVRDFDDVQKGLKVESAEAAAKVPYLRDRSEEGGLIREAILNEKAAAKEEMDILADVLKIDLQGRPKGMQNVKQDIQDKFFKKNKLLQNNVPKVIRDIALMKEKGINYQEWGEFRGMIGEQLSEAIAKGKSTQIRQLAEFKSFWDDLGDNGFKELGENGRIFREAYQKRFIPFDSGVAYKVTQPTEFNRPAAPSYVTKDEKIADAFFGDKQSAVDFMALTENTPEARDSMKKIILDRAYEFAQAKPNSPFAGSLDPDKLQSFMNKNREALAVMGLEGELGDARSIMTGVEIRNAELTARRNAMDKDKLNKLLDMAKPGEETMLPTEIFDKALKDTKIMELLSARVKATKDPELMKQLRDGISSRLTATHPMDNPKAFLETLNDKNTQERLLKVFTPEHLENIALVAEAQNIVNTTGMDVSKGSGIDHLSFPDLIHKLTGTSPVMISSLARAAAEGRNSWHNVAMLLGSRMWTSKQKNAFDRKLWSALMDPEKARDLAIPLNEGSKIPGSVDRRVKSWMFNLGVGAPEEGEPEVVPGGLKAIPGWEDTPGGEQPPMELKGIRPNTNKQGSLTPAMSAPPPSAPPTAQGPSAAPPGPPVVQDPKYSQLFPFDELGSAIASSQHLAKGGPVKKQKVPFDRRGFRESDNVEDRRNEERDIWMDRLLSDTNNIGRSVEMSRSLADEYGEAMSKKRTAKEQKAIEDAIHAGRKEREAGYPKTKDPFLRDVGAMVEPREPPRPKMASELEWGEKPGTMTYDPAKAMGGIGGYANGGLVRPPFPGADVEQLDPNESHGGPVATNILHGLVGLGVGAYDSFKRAITLPRRVYDGEVDLNDKDKAWDESMNAAGILTLGGGARAGLAKPLATGETEIGIFGGRRSVKGAEQNEKMLEGYRTDLGDAVDGLEMGAGPIDTFHKTGWFKGPDGKMRFEIDDSKSKFIPRTREQYAADYDDIGKGGSGIGRRLDEVIDHPELFKEYPILRDLRVKETAGPGEGWARLNEGVIQIPAYGEDRKSILLHEIQHFVQKHEGFTQGTNPEAVGMDLSGTLRKKMKELRGSSDENDQAKAVELEQMFDQMQRMPSKQQQGLLWRLYARHAGEAEARLVQDRMDMGPIERMVNPPWENYTIEPYKQVKQSLQERDLIIPENRDIEDWRR